MNDPQADHDPPTRGDPGILDRALALVEFLRGNCEWDAKQTHHSLRRYLLEECHEVIDAIDAGDDCALRDELGDLLLNVAFQIVLAEERESFDRDEVVRGLEAKMRRRHPHLYGGDPLPWEVIKARERGVIPKDGILSQLVAGTDPLAHANTLQARVARFGFDWPNAGGAWAKVREEVEEVEAEADVGDAGRIEEEIGDLLFSVVNFARLSDVHPTVALARANAKFARRFERLEELAAARGIEIGEVPLEVLDELWDRVKEEEV